MSADFIYAIMPRVEITEEREVELMNTLTTLSEDDITKASKIMDISCDNQKEILDEIKWKLEEFIEIMKTAAYDNEIGILCLPGMENEYLITGGMSWGDSPTEAFDLFIDIGEIKSIYDKLLVWSKEGMNEEIDEAIPQLGN